MYYFAYGSNMSSRYLQNVRHIQPVKSIYGYVEGYEVYIYGSGFLLLEPGFAVMSEATGKQAHGVVHQLSPNDIKRIKRSEGSMYEWKTLLVHIGNGDVVEAEALVLQPKSIQDPRPAARCSSRYQSIMLDGAREHGLPQTYISEVESRSTTYIPILSEIVGFLIVLLVKLYSMRKRD